MAKKATHFGTCQVCGSRQKAPGGRVAKHGYTVALGFFEGTCWGSDEKPYEISCDALPPAIKRAKKRVAEARAKANELRTADYSNVDVAMVSVYEKDRYNGKGGYVWRSCKVEMTCHERSDYVHFTFTTSYEMDMGTVWEGNVPTRKTKTVSQRQPFYGTNFTTVAEAVLELNSDYAKVFDKKVASGLDFIAWAKKKIDDWKLLPLTPVK